jgi:hypothetical protein
LEPGAVVCVSGDMHLEAFRGVRIETRNVTLIPWPSNAKR